MPSPISHKASPLGVIPSQFPQVTSKPLPRQLLNAFAPKGTISLRNRAEVVALLGELLLWAVCVEENSEEPHDAP